MTRMVAAALFALAIAGAQAQPAPATPSMADVLSGSVCPLSYKLKDLGPDWRRVSVSQGGDASYMQFIMLAMGAGGQNDVYYTKGQTLTILGETYVVAYKVPSKPVDLSSLSSMNRASMASIVVTPKPDENVNLCLLNLRSAGSLTDIRAFDLQAETTPPAAEEPSEAAPASPDADVPASPPANAGPEATSLSNLRQLGLALQMYTADYDGTLPALKDIATAKKVLLPYCKNEALFASPVTGSAYQVNPAISGKKLKHLGGASSFVAIYETKPGKDGKRGVAFADGQARRVPEKEWPALRRASKIP